MRTATHEQCVYEIRLTPCERCGRRKWKCDGHHPWQSCEKNGYSKDYDDPQMRASHSTHISEGAKTSNLRYLSSGSGPEFFALSL